VAQVRGLSPKVGGRLALFYVHCVNRVYGTLVVTSWTCYGGLYVVSSLLLSSLEDALITSFDLMIVGRTQLSTVGDQPFRVDATRIWYSL